VSYQQQVGTGARIPPWGQPLDPLGTNIITYLLERWTDQDPKWDVAQKWLGRVDPELSILKSPLRGNSASIVTTNRYSNVDVNIAYQGTGIQKILTIMAAIIFSPEGSTIIVEEPEVHLHKESQKVLADLFNSAVNTMKKQVIFSTHSWDILLPYISDVAKDMRKRGADAVPIDPSKVRVEEFTRKEGKISIQEYPLRDHGFKDAATHFGQLLG
jgi:predicted ATPase